MGRSGVQRILALGLLSALGSCAGLQTTRAPEADVDSLRIPAPATVAMAIELPVPVPPASDERPELHKIHRPSDNVADIVLLEPPIISKGLVAARSASQQLDRWDDPLTGWTAEPPPQSVGETRPPAGHVAQPAPIESRAPAEVIARAPATQSPTQTPGPVARATPVRSVPATIPEPSPLPLDLAEEEVYVQTGDNVQISLASTGWILSGSPEEGIAEFLSREQEASRTVFEFRGVGPGTAVLDFVRQDHSLGAQQKQRFRLAVVSEMELQARLSGVSSPDLGDVDRRLVEQLLSLGRLDEARAELERTYRPESDFHNEALARISRERGDAEAAQTYWGRNLPNSVDAAALTPYHEKALVGTMELALKRADLPLVVKTLVGLLAVRTDDTSTLLLDSAAFLLKQNQAGAALEALEGYQRRYPRASGADRFFFILAQVFEADTVFRDLTRSRDYYETVYDGFPESLLAEEARKRARFLDRHFLKIR